MIDLCCVGNSFGRKLRHLKYCDHVRLEISFAEKSLRTMAENHRSALRRLGPAAAAGLRDCLSDLEAAPTARDLPPIYKLMAQRDGFLTHELTSECFAMFACAHVSIPRLESQDVDWSKVTRMKLVRIGGVSD